MGSQGSSGPHFLAFTHPQYLLSSPLSSSCGSQWVPHAPVPTLYPNKTMLCRGVDYSHAHLVTGASCSDCRSMGPDKEDNIYGPLVPGCLPCNCPRSSSRVPQLEARGGSPRVPCTAEVAGLGRKEGTLTRELLQQQQEGSGLIRWPVLLAINQSISFYPINSFKCTCTHVFIHMWSYT